MNASNGQPSGLMIVESALWFYHDVKSIPKVFFNSFCTAKTILYLFYTSPKYLHIDVSLFGLLFSNFTQWFQALTKWFIIFIYILYYFFLPKSEVKSTSESCLPGLVPWEIPEPKLILWGIKKVVTDVFYCS